MIFKNNGGKVIAELSGTTLKKKVSFKLHHLYSFKGWGIDKEVIDKVKDSCKDIEIKDKDSGKVFKTTFKDFWEHKFPLPNWGYGNQYALSDKYWIIEIANQNKLKFR